MNPFGTLLCQAAKARSQLLSVLLRPAIGVMSLSPCKDPTLCRRSLNHRRPRALVRHKFAQRDTRSSDSFTSLDTRSLVEPEKFCMSEIEKPTGTVTLVQLQLDKPTRDTYCPYCHLMPRGWPCGASRSWLGVGAPIRKQSSQNFFVSKLTWSFVL